MEKNCSNRKNAEPGYSNFYKERNTSKHIMLDAKRGSTTLFIVLGIVIAIVVLLAVFIIGPVKPIESDASFSLAVSNIKNNIESCSKEVGKNGLILAGLQSGRYDNFANPIEQKDDYYGFEKFSVSHFIKAGSQIKFSFDDVEAEINKNYNDKLPECLNNFESYKERGYEIEPKEMSVDVEFLDESTRFILTYEVVVSKAGKIETLKDYMPAELPYRFRRVFDIATNAAGIHAGTGAIPINYIISNDLKLINYRVGRSIIYRIVDQKDDEERRYVFYFAVS